MLHSVDYIAGFRVKQKPPIDKMHRSNQIVKRCTAFASTPLNLCMANADVIDTMNTLADKSLARVTFRWR
jgi:hypothetical protein